MLKYHFGILTFMSQKRKYMLSWDELEISFVTSGDKTFFMLNSAERDFFPAQQLLAF